MDTGIHLALCLAFTHSLDPWLSRMKHFTDMCGMKTDGSSTQTRPQLATVTQEEDKMAVSLISETSSVQDDREETEELDREPEEEDEGLHYYLNVRFGCLRPNVVCSINVHFSPNIIFKPQPCPSSFISSNAL